MKLRYKILTIAVALIGLCSCNDFLEKVPDTRVYLVNLEHVDSIEGEMIRVGEISVPISQGEKESALNALDRYLSDAGV